MLANFLLSPCVNFLLFLLLLPNVFVNVGAREVPIGDYNYTVVFDAGSSGTRVHVFNFSYKHELMPINGSLQFYKEVTPGLGKADDPEKPANSIKRILHDAVEKIPTEARSHSHLQLGATTGLALDVGPDKLKLILDAVEKLFKDESSSLLYNNKNCKVEDISGDREGAYMWVAVNYLLRSLGKKYKETVDIINLGGGSVEMSYAVDPSAPKTVKEYITEHELGMKYHLYVRSYSGYGQDAARAKLLESAEGTDNDCILKGLHEQYTYNGKTYTVSSTSESNFEGCKKNVEKVLNLEAECEVHKCTFDVWNGGGGARQKKLYLASAFFSTEQDVKIIDPEGKASPENFKKAAETACALKSLEEAKKKYKSVLGSNLPFICMDLVHQYTLLTKGFGLEKTKKVTLIREVEYNKGFNVNATWALGSAIETVSGVASTKTEANNMFRFWSHAYTE